MHSSSTAQPPAGRRRPGTTIVLLSSMLLVGSLSRCKTTPTRSKQAPLAIRAVEIRRGAITQSLEYVGTVHSRREVKVLARVQGTVSKLPFPEGSRVKKGVTIARMSARDLAASYRRTAAEVRKAAAERTHECHWYRQYRKLEKSGTVARLAVDRHRKACQAASAGYQAAKASRTLRSVIVGKTRERAPFDGRVLQWLAEPGQNVMPGQPILLFGNEAREARVQVVESDLRRHIRVGTPVTIALDGRLHALKVGEIAPVARGVGRTVQIKIPLPDSTSTSLRNGMSINVSFVVAHEEHAQSVPTTAVRRSGPHSAVYLVEGKRVRRVPVRVGVRNGRWVQVHGKLPHDATVAVTNLDQLSDRSRVYVVKRRKRPDEH